MDNIGNYWSEPKFREMTYWTFGFLFLLVAVLFPFRKKNGFTISLWASTQSWIITAPFAYLMFVLGSPWPTLVFAIMSLLGIKEFFQMTGIYHKSSFVWISYLAILTLAWAAHNNMVSFYNLLPMIFAGVIALIPILKNNAKNMIQYMALSLMGYIFLGWGFLHALWIIQIPAHGVYLLIFITTISEFSDQTNVALGRLYGNRPLVNNITPLRTYEGLAASVSLSIVLGYALRHLLPYSDVSYWLTLSLTASLVGSLGDLVLSVIRRDIGVRDTGVFIIGRGGFLDRMDRLIFVFPISYYIIQHLEQLFRAS